jgi:hypothetical protein
MTGTALISGLPLSADDYVFALLMYFEGFKRSRWRSGNVAAGEIELAVVASAPDAVLVRFVLHRATQVRACGGKRLELSAGRMNQQARTITKSKDLGGVRRQLADLPGNHGVAA